MNDDFLNNYRKEPRAEFAAALHQRISNPMQTGLHRNTWRFAAASVAVLAVLTLSTVFSPSALAFAQQVVHQVGGYIFVLGGQPVNVRGAPSVIQIVKTQGSISMETLRPLPSTDDPAEASRMARFTVLSPSYLPAGFSAMSGWFINSDSGGMVATKGYRDSTGHFLVINQGQVGYGALREFNRPAIVEVPVRGQPGLWLPAAENGGPGQKRALVWEENGITYWLITASLPLDEMLKVAEGLGK